MNKKIMVVALMATLSTLGYAFETVGGNVENLNTTNHGTWNQTTMDKINSNVNSIVSKTDENFTSVQNQLNNKVNKDDVYTKTDADNKFASKDQLNSAVDKINKDLGQNLIDTDNKINGVYNELNGKLEEKADANNVYTKDQADDKFASKDQLNSAVDKINKDLGQNLIDTDNKINGVYNELTEKIDKKADQTAVDNLKDDLGKLNEKSDFNDEQLNNKLNDEIKNREEADNKLQVQIDKNKDEQSKIDAGQNQVIDGLNNQLGDLANNVIQNKEEQEKVDAGQNQVIDGLNNQLGDLANNVIQNKEEQEKVDAGQNQVIDGLNNQLGDLANNVIQNKEDQAKVDKLQDEKIAPLDKNKVDKNTYEEDKKAQANKDAEQDAAIALGDRVNNVQNQQIGNLQTENVEQNNKIAALDKNKVDKNTYEEDKKVQANKDAEQDAAIALGDRVNNVQNQQIGNLQSQNLEQDRNIQANKNAIAANKAEQDKVNAEQKGNNKQQQEAIDKNTSDITTNRNDIADLRNDYAQVNGRVSGLEKRVDHLDNKMNKGLSLMAAMNAVDFQSVQAGEMAIGAGVGHYGNAQSVALGVAYSPVEDLTVNAKYSVTAGDPDSFAVGAGATYKFKVGR